MDFGKTCLKKSEEEKDKEFSNDDAAVIKKDKQKFKVMQKVAQLVNRTNNRTFFV